MNNKEFQPQVYTCMKYYDKTGKRVSIKATQMNREKMIVETFYCSKKDVFRKKRSREIFAAMENHHSGEIKEMFGITIHSQIIEIEGSKPKKQFLEWCRSNFYHYAPCYTEKQILIPCDYLAAINF